MVYDMIYDMIWYMTWHDMTWHDMIWHKIYLYLFRAIGYFDGIGIPLPPVVLNFTDAQRLVFHFSSRGLLYLILRNFNTRLDT